MMPLLYRVVLLLLFAVQFQACGSTSAERFIGLGWNSTRTQVIDSVNRWRFKYNEAKARWEGGMIRGFFCDKLRLGFDTEGYLNFVDARFENRDERAANSAHKFLHSKVAAVHGEPSSSDSTAGGQVPMRREVWSFSDRDQPLQDMIILLRFTDKVVYQAGKNLPQVFELKE